jgi:hypothetical protein
MFLNDSDSEVIEEGLTLGEARAYCRDPETSSRTCHSKEGMALTESRGPWFCGYEEE